MSYKHGARSFGDQTEQFTCCDVSIKQELKGASKSNHKDNKDPQREGTQKADTTIRRELNSWFDNNFIIGKNGYWWEQSTDCCKKYVL